MQKQVSRCPWVDLTKQYYLEYHDKEWGVPVHDDHRLVEFLILEGAQAGLSWYTVLRKRENYRKLFDGFDPRKIAGYDDLKIEQLLGDAGIIRNRAKITATINNAQRFLEVQKEFGNFNEYIWQFTNHGTIFNKPKTLKDLQATSKESDAMSKDLKEHGFKFVGSTICYAYMQAAGMVNDHLTTCFCYKALR